MIPLSFEKLSVRIAERTLFSDLSCQLPVGIFSLFGENGIGKSTLLRTLAGIHEPAIGKIFIDGIDLLTQGTTAKRRLGYVPDRPMAYPGMSGLDLLELVCKIKGVAYSDYANPLVERFRLTQHLTKPFDSMSLGTQKKFFIIAGAIGQPRVLILDEPTNAIDQYTRAELAQLFLEYSANSLVLFATHDDDFAKCINARRLQLHADLLAVA